MVVTDEPGGAAHAVEEGEHAVLVTLAALARTASVVVPVGAVDEAKDLATHGDLFDPWDEPDPADPALRTPDGETSYAALVPDRPADPGHRGRRGRRGRAGAHGDHRHGAFLRTALDAWAGDGSLVVGRGEPAPDVLAARLEAEGVTRRA